MMRRVRTGLGLISAMSLAVLVVACGGPSSASHPASLASPAAHASASASARPVAVAHEPTVDELTVACVRAPADVADVDAFADQVSACRQVCAVDHYGECETLGDLVLARKGDATPRATAGEAYSHACLRGHRETSCKKLDALTAQARGECAPEDPDACMTYGDLLLDRATGAQRDALNDAAITAYEVACEKHRGDGCRRAGSLRMDRGHEQSAHGRTDDGTAEESRGRSLLRRGCDFGQGGACCDMAVLYDVGRGVDPNPELAEKFSLRAQSHGYPDCEEVRASARKWMGGHP